MIEEAPPTRALRERSPEILTRGLRQLVADAAADDPRDLQRAMATYHDCARRLGLDVAAVFEEAAAAAPAGVRDLVAGFGRRTDVTPRTFHYVVEERGGRPEYRSWTPPPATVDEIEALVAELGVEPAPDWRARMAPESFARQGCVASAEEQAAVEGVVRDALVGHPQTAVRYVGPGHGIEFELWSGATWSVAGRKDANETLVVYAGTVGDELRVGGEARTWNASAVWRASFGDTVRSVEAAWSEGSGAPRCLRTLLLRGAGERCAVIASVGEQPDVSGSVAVFFSLAEARAAGVLLPGGPGATT